MKKALLFSLILLAAAGCDMYQSPTENAPTPQEQLQTYKNSTYGFEFQYPKEMQFRTANHALLQDKVAELVIPQSTYPNTNFGDAAFSVSAGYAKSLATCLQMSSPENGDGFKTQQQINGTTFYTTKSTGVGAGNIYESKIYRAWVGNQTCIELNETIHTSNIGNYPEGTVTEVNKIEVQSNLDKVLNSFKFTE